jgi:hypothetical protein
VVKGARAEGVAVQVVLTSDAPLAGITPAVTSFVGPQGTALPADAVSLYRVDYVQVTTTSDPAGVVGEWPDPLRPIGKDRSYQEDRNGAPFSLTPGRNQPVWVDIRIPRNTLPGTYSATFQVLDPAGTVTGSLPVQLTVWALELPRTPALPTSYGFSRGTAFRYHYQKPKPTTPAEEQQADELAQRYLEEAAAHRISLDVVDAYVAGNAPNYNWTAWDPFVAPPGVSPSSFPVPSPPGQPLKDVLTWTAAQRQAAADFWAVGAQRYAARGWLSQNYLYTQDEPNTPLKQQMAIAQSTALHQGSTSLRSLVTHAYDAALEPGNFDIWVPNVTALDPTRTGSLDQPYLTKQAAGKHVWWYDSNNSNFPGNHPAPGGAYGRWPDHFIDHPGVNQLVHGPLTYRYGLEGFLYYNTLEAYTLGANPDPWHQLYVSAYLTNGDGTLFYPGTPSEVGPATGGHHIPVPSIRLQILRQSWAMYDMLRMLADRGGAADARAVAANLAPTTTTWTANPADFEAAREQLAARLQPVTGIRIVSDRSTFSESEVAGTGMTEFPRSFYVVVDGILPAQLGLLTIPADQAGRDAVAPTITATRPAGPVPGMTAVCTDVAGEGPVFDPYLVQRVTFTYSVRFASTAAFYLAGVGQEYQDVTLTATAAQPAPLQATATAALIRQPNPFLLDGPVPWLSGDARVFQVSSLKPPPFPSAAALPQDPASARAFLATVLGELDVAPANFDLLPTGAEQSQLELAPTRQQQPVFNFAIARVRYRGQAVAAGDVRAFFRLFTTAATGLDYHVNGNYRRSAPYGPAISLLGAPASGMLTTLPFFAAERVDTATQPMSGQLDPGNVKTLPPGGGQEIQRFFGAWLDINQPAIAQFPANPGAASDGPWPTGRQPIQDLIRNRHQCMVAEIYFVPTSTTGDPIPEGATPVASENLGQRNLVIVESANPGTPDSRTVHHTLLIQPRGGLQGGTETADRAEDEKAETAGEQPAEAGRRDTEGLPRWVGDELMISWPRIPTGARARLTVTGLDATATVRLAIALGAPPVLTATGRDTLAFEAGGVTYIPLPRGRDALPGLFRVELPAGIRAGDSYSVLIQQVRDRRRITGSIEVLIPVRHADELLPEEEHTLAIFRSIQRSLSPDDPWGPVMTDYVDQIAKRVHGFGGTPEGIRPSPWGSDQPPERRRLLRSAVPIAAIAALLLRYLRARQRGLPSDPV